jgi:3-hydroxyisobutyrate dehydrogenase-like beta-hydroxyacid dehydrogenase
MQVGFIGLGTMGASMATNLQKAGYKLVVHDVHQNSATPHLKAGAEWADSPKLLATQCQVIFTSLPGPPEVEVVALGPNGLIEGMEKGSAWFDLTTTHQRSYARFTSSVGSGACTCLTPR